MTAQDTTFLAAINFEGYGGINEAKLLSGINCYAQDILFNAKWGASLAAAYEMTWVGLYESQIVVSNKQVVLRY